MVLQKQLLVCTAAVALTGATALPAAAAPWTRGFVVSAYEYAFRYGGRNDYSRGAEIEPGVDCPHGSTVFMANPNQTKIAIARQKWRSQQEVDWITAPPGVEKVNTPGLTRRHIWARAMSFRGYKKGIETYVNPWATDDPGEPQVTSSIGDGFNLDGQIKPGDFISPEGEKGIDNNLYRAWGCDAPWRGGGNATLDMRANDKMQEGLFTMVIRVSGNKDPQDDDDATLEIGWSPDNMVKNARGGITVDYSYRLPKTQLYTKMKAKVVNGVVESEQVEHLHTPRIAWFYDQTGDTNIAKAKIRLNIAPDGLSATGLMGGYRNWRDLYAENTFAQDGGQQGTREHEDAVALYYALRRNADGMLNPKTGRYDGISMAYRLRMSSAFVVDPSEPMEITKQPEEEAHKAAFQGIKEAVIRGSDTLVPQAVPPGTTEGSYPALEHEMDGLISREYFLKILERPHYAGEDARGMPPWLQKKKPAASPAKEPLKQQVRNGEERVAERTK